MTSFYTPCELKQLGFKSVGNNVFISRNACIYGAGGISIGDNVRIDDFCILSGRITLQNRIHIAAACLLFGGKSGILMKDFSGLSSRCAIYADSDDYSGNALTNPMIPDKYRSIQGGLVTLEKHALVGSNCTILPGVTVKEGASVGSMSLVTKSLDEWGIYVGIPCKRIKDRSRKILKIEDEFWVEMNGDKE
ncbi:acyltransferase [Blautia schinkii]|nr:acyltransferase [Blautia schinkii]